MVSDKKIIDMYEKKVKSLEQENAELRRLLTDPDSPSGCERLRVLLHACTLRAVSCMRAPLRVKWLEPQLLPHWWSPTSS